MRSVLIALCAFLLGLAALASWRALHAIPPQGTQHAATNTHAAILPAPARSVAQGDIENPAPADSSNMLSDQDWPHDAPTPEQVIYSQPELLDKAIGQLKPRTSGKVNLYAIAFAGDGSENVFRNEAEYLQRLFASRFDAAGHVLVLENNPATLATQPLADWSNLETALDAVAAKMDPRQDILLLYLTTHGSEDHTLLVDMDPLPLDQIDAGDLPGILAEHPFRHRVVIVNACYSGGFIPPLRGAGTHGHHRRARRSFFVRLRLAIAAHLVRTCLPGGCVEQDRRLPPGLRRRARRNRGMGNQRPLHAVRTAVVHGRRHRRPTREMARQFRSGCSRAVCSCAGIQDGSIAIRVGKPAMQASQRAHSNPRVTSVRRRERVLNRRDRRGSRTRHHPQAREKWPSNRH